VQDRLLQDLHAERQGPDGKWQTVPTYYFEDELPYGHGEKSVYILWASAPDAGGGVRHPLAHGLFRSEDNRTVSDAMRRYPLAFALATADMEATVFLEKE
jgi:hypothetical protein